MYSVHLIIPQKWNFSLFYLIEFIIFGCVKGICLDREIPGHETPERASQYRFCDRCKVWQPPDGVHCPECNVCIKGYDHHCVWIGTCIGKRNYRQFVLFNMMVSYY